jgi:ABC-type uncharacterized transport system substrate-binding protein
MTNRLWYINISVQTKAHTLPLESKKEFCWAESQHSRLPALAADLVGRQVAVVVAPGGAPAGVAAKSVTAF